MSEIIVKEGDGLYRDGVKLKLEFGNIEQINAIRKHEKRIKEFTENGVSPTCSWTVKGNAFFTCICGKNVFEEDVPADSDNDEDCFDGIAKKCRSCDRNYEFVVNREYKVNSNGKKYIWNQELRVKLKIK